MIPQKVLSFIIRMELNDGTPESDVCEFVKETMGIRNTYSISTPFWWWLCVHCCFFVVLLLFRQSSFITGVPERIAYVDPRTGGTTSAGSEQLQAGYLRERKTPMCLFIPILTALSCPRPFWIGGGRRGVPKTQKLL